jgi:hypothetical protein
MIAEPLQVETPPAQETVTLEQVQRQIDQLTPDQLRALVQYILARHVQFVGPPPSATAEPAPVQAPEPPSEPQKKRILGLHAHLGPHWMSDDFNDELPMEFWLGEDA